MAVVLFSVQLRVSGHHGRHVVIAVDQDNDVFCRFLFGGNEIGIKLNAVKRGHLPVEDVHAVTVKPVLASSEDRVLINGKR